MPPIPRAWTQRPGYQPQPGPRPAPPSSSSAVISPKDKNTHRGWEPPKGKPEGVASGHTPSPITTSPVHDAALLTLGIVIGAFLYALGPVLIP